jgi:5-formyltetrahydrofolate cyclo-ligase
MNSELKQQKNALREQMRRKLKTLSTHEKTEASQTLTKRIAQYIQNNPQIQTVATFAALPFEPDLGPLHELTQDVSLIYPKSALDGSMLFYRVESARDLTLGLYNIPEPKAEEHNKVSAKDIDLFLCPAFAYTKEGARLGKGGGYYDRLLAERSQNSELLGVIFDCQLFKHIPTESHDISVDQVFSA